jgi:hypothetical protein
MCAEGSNPARDATPRTIQSTERGESWAEAFAPPDLGAQRSINDPG